jgi:hypothetical protein
MGVPEDSCVRLHGLLHVETDLRSMERTIRVSGFVSDKMNPPRYNIPNLVKVFNALDTSFLWNCLVGLSGGQSLLDVVGAGSTENDNVQKRVGSKSVGTVDRHTRGFSGGVQSRHNLVLTFL